MVSKSRKNSRGVSRLFRDLYPEDKQKSMNAHNKMRKTYKAETKAKKRVEREDKRHDRIYTETEKKYGTKYIQNLPPHKWICKCGTLNHGGMESRVGNAVIVRCHSCEGSGVREIK